MYACMRMCAFKVKGIEYFPRDFACIWMHLQLSPLPFSILCMSCIDFLDFGGVSRSYRASKSFSKPFKSSKVYLRAILRVWVRRPMSVVLITHERGSYPSHVGHVLTHRSGDS